MNLKTLKIISFSIMLASTASYALVKFASNPNTSNVLASGPASVKMDFGNLQNKLPATTSTGAKLIVRATYIDSNNNTWVGTNGGLYMKSSPEGAFIAQGDANGFSKLIFTAIYQDADGTLWFSCSANLNAYQGQIWYLKGKPSTDSPNNFQNINVPVSAAYKFSDVILNWPGNIFGVDPGNRTATAFIDTTDIVVVTQNDQGVYSLQVVAQTFLKGLPSGNDNTSAFISYDKSNNNWLVLIPTDGGLYYASNSTPTDRPFQPVLVSGTFLNIMTSCIFVNGNLVVGGVNVTTHQSMVLIQNSGSIYNMSTVTFVENDLVYPDGTKALNTLGEKIANTTLSFDSINNRLFIGTNAWAGSNPQNYSSLFVANDVNNNSTISPHEVVLESPTPDEYSAWNLQTAISSISLDKKGNPSIASSTSNVFWQFPKIHSNTIVGGLSGGAIAGIVIGAVAAVSILGYSGYKFGPKLKKSMAQPKTKK